MITLASLMVPAVAIAENAEQAYQKARDAYYALQNSSRKQMYREQWERVFERFDSVYERFPESRRGADALYMCGKTVAGLYGISRIRPDAERAVELEPTTDAMDLLWSWNNSIAAGEPILSAAQELELIPNEMFVAPPFPEDRFFAVGDHRRNLRGSFRGSRVFHRRHAAVSQKQCGQARC